MPSELRTTVNISLAWSRVISKQGAVSTTQARSEPGNGLWIASFRVPHTDNQGTMHYFAVDGVIMMPSFCLNGQQRDAAHKEALRYYQP